MAPVHGPSMTIVIMGCVETYVAILWTSIEALTLSKLKFLYVAITRARKNLWIADNSEKCEPMRVGVLT